MKKFTLLTILILCQSYSIKAQWINSITTIPIAPTTNDTILIIADCMFSSGSCDQHTQGYFINGTIIDAWALHCTGMLTVICSHTDTFKINPLPAGNYKFRFQLDQGQLPSPCTPGFVPGPHDSLTFTVQQFMSVNDIAAQGITILVKHNAIKLSNINNYNLQFILFSADGRKVIDKNLANGESNFDLPFARGIYNAVIVKDNQRILNRKILIH